MNVAALRLLTWTTVITAVASALWLAALGGDLNERIGSLEKPDALNAQLANVTARQTAPPPPPGTAERRPPSPR